MRIASTVPSATEMLFAFGASAGLGHLLHPDRVEAPGDVAFTELRPPQNANR